MDTGVALSYKVALLREFYAGLPKDRAKLETYEHGFDFLDGILATGARLEYGELAFTGMLHKYKFSAVPEGLMDRFLEAHVRKESNICLYFGHERNSLFCVNLDNNHKTNNTELIPEMTAAVKLLRDILAGLGCEALVIASGRGYHLWGRLAEPQANEEIYDLMLRAMARALFGVHKAGLDHNRIKANFYPDPRSQDVVSLRLFGSVHIKNGVFSRVLNKDGTLLDEEESWGVFGEFLRGGTIETGVFLTAVERIRETEGKR